MIELLFFLFFQPSDQVMFTFSESLPYLTSVRCLIPFVYRYSVENAYLEEKEDTYNALGEISENSG